MTIASVSNLAWTSILTTSGDTVFQNRGAKAMYLTTEATGSLEFAEGFELMPGQAIIIGTGKAVSAVTFDNAADLYYVLVA
jgi:hypothetical protein